MHKASKTYYVWNVTLSWLTYTSTSLQSLQCLILFTDHLNNNCDHFSMMTGMFKIWAHVAEFQIFKA